MFAWCIEPDSLGFEVEEEGLGLALAWSDSFDCFEAHPDGKSIVVGFETTFPVGVSDIDSRI